MKKIKGFHNLDKIYESSQSLLYRAVQEHSQQPVILKLLNNAHPSPEEAFKLKREYELTISASGDEKVQILEPSESDDTLALIMQDIGGDSLANILHSQKLGIEEFLDLAVQISEIVEQIHDKKIIHKDINPANIVWNRQKNQVRIIDFGIATELPREVASVEVRNVVEGTLAYISPEQTGRMNRSLDYRTDFYSLGITFYWMLTGRVPFESDEVLELLHSHIAKRPVAPHLIEDAVPEPISAIVMKLMSKDAESRYQSAHGLVADLTRCLNQWRKTATISPFALGDCDVSDRFQIPQKLYGREQELGELLAAFEQVREGSTELTLVSGIAGVGKSILINELHGSIAHHKGYFVSGKYERIKRDVPYSAIIQALSDLARRIISDGDACIEKWKNRLSPILGPNGKIITDFVPLFEVILGPQPEVPGLPPQQSQNRFYLVIQNFLKMLATSEQPLILFLDDLQWADLGSLYILKLFTAVSDIKHILVVGSYRVNEVRETDPLWLTLKEIEDSGATVRTLFLEPLESEHVKLLLDDMFNKPKASTSSFAELLVEKTKGNPFFVHEFLKALYKKGLIDFSFEQGWSWDIAGIQKMHVTENVVDLMVEKITELPQPSQEVLKLGACIGNYFDLATLVIVWEKPEKEILPFLNVALQEGMLTKTDDVYRFFHDRIHEASYSLISDDDKRDLHYQIGNLVLQNVSEKELQKKIFYIVNQLNAGISRVKESSEKRKLAELNFNAGTKALAANAYTSALNFLQAGISLLDQNCWIDDYRFTLELYERATSAAALSAEYELMEELADAVLRHAHQILDKIQVYETKIFACQARSDLVVGIRIGLSVLEQLEFQLPERPTKLRVVYELVKLRSLIRGKDVEDLVNLSEMRDPRQLAIMRIISGMGSSAHKAAPELLPLLIIRAVRLSIEHGNSIYTPYVYAGLGVIVCGVMGDSSTADKLGKTALDLIDKLNMKQIKSRTSYIVWLFINHWNKPIRDCIDPFLEAYKAGLETGDLEFAALSAYSYAKNHFYVRTPLSKVERLLEKYSSAIKHLNQHTILNYISIHRQFVVNLQGGSPDPCRLTGPAYDGDKKLPVLIQQGDDAALLLFYGYTLNANYLLENYLEAQRNADLARPIGDTQLAHPSVPFVVFYDSLAHLALCKGEKNSVQKQHLKRVAKNQRKMRKWAQNCPENYSNKYHLVEAEICRIGKKNIQKSIEHYKLAVSLARENKCLQEEALALKLTAKFWLENDNSVSAAAFMKMARLAYQRWGASAIVKHLEENYKDILAATTERTDRTPRTMTSSNTFNLSAEIDFSTVMKASQAISSEIDLGRLLETIMRFCVENTGANKACLIVRNQEDGSHWLEATIETDRDVEVLQSTPIEQCSRLCLAIVQFVIKTGETVVLHDGRKDPHYSDDPYIAEHQIKSLLCTPIKRKGKSSGIIYLENSLAANTFTDSRLELLRVLAAQAAISIENVMLLADREQAARLRTEMDIAANIQTGLLPVSPTIEGYEISAYMRPADEVGGDYYDVINVADRDWLVIGDVSGHGVPAGLVMMMVQTSIHTVLTQHPDIPPSELLAIINKVIKQNIVKLNESKYMTITVLATHKDDKFYFAGLHLDILVYRAPAHEVERIPTKGMWIGLMDCDTTMYPDDSFTLGKDDTMLLYTDGITEARKKNTVWNASSPIGEMLGETRLEKILKREGEKPIAQIEKAILRELEDYDVDDDITMVVMRKK